MQNLGMSRLYNEDKRLKALVRSVVALPFIQINQMEAALDELRDMEMTKESRHYNDMVRFKEDFLNYFEDTWIQ